MSMVSFSYKPNTDQTTSQNSSSQEQDKLVEVMTKGEAFRDFCIKRGSPDYQEDFETFRRTIADCVLARQDFKYYVITLDYKVAYLKKELDGDLFIINTDTDEGKIQNFLMFNPVTVQAICDLAGMALNCSTKKHDVLVFPQNTLRFMEVGVFECTFNEKDYNAEPELKAKSLPVIPVVLDAKALMPLKEPTIGEINLCGHKIAYQEKLKESPEFPRNLYDDYQKNKKYCDFELVSRNGIKFPIHSKVYYLHPKRQISNEKFIKLDVSEPTVRSFIDFLYLTPEEIYNKYKNSDIEITNLIILAYRTCDSDLLDKCVEMTRLDRTLQEKVCDFLDKADKKFELKAFKDYHKIAENEKFKEKIGRLKEKIDKFNEKQFETNPSNYISKKSVVPSRVKATNQPDQTDASQNSSISIDNLERTSRIFDRQVLALSQTHEIDEEEKTA